VKHHTHIHTRRYTPPPARLRAAFYKAPFSSGKQFCNLPNPNVPTEVSLMESQECLKSIFTLHRAAMAQSTIVSPVSSSSSSKPQAHGRPHWAGDMHMSLAHCSPGWSAMGWMCSGRQAVKALEGNGGWCHHPPLGLHGGWLWDTPTADGRASQHS
jgi:hypothetical protein